MLDLENVFSTGDNTDVNLEKAIRAIAYLLEWSSNIGNESPDGFAVYGLGKLLQKCADQVPRLQPEIVVVGGAAGSGCQEGETRW